MAFYSPQKIFGFVPFPCLNTKPLGESSEFKATHETNLVYRDELDKKKPEPIKTKRIKKVTFSDDKATERKSHDYEVNDNKKEVMRVRVKMTKEQAARLLSKCKDGGVLGFKDVAGEIVQLPMNRITNIETLSPEKEQAVLKSIPEEVEF